jgi:hypothetical protein
MLHQKVELQFRVRWVVFGIGWRKSLAVILQGLGVDREKDEEIIFEQGIDERSLALLEANGNGFAAKA